MYDRGTLVPIECVPNANPIRIYVISRGFIPTVYSDLLNHLLVEIKFTIL